MNTAFYSHPDCRLHDMGPGHPECPQRLDAITDHLLAIGLDIALDFREAPVATLEQIERAHTTHYVTELLDHLERLRNDGETKAFDPDTVACPGTWHAALRAASARCGHPATTPRATRRWASASSTTWRWRRATRSTCTA